MPTDETRTSLKRLGIAVTSYEDAVLQGASAESVAEAAGEARAALKEVTAIVDRLRGTPSMRPTTVQDVMTADPQVIAPDASIEEAHSTLHSRGFRHLPVVEGGRLVWILSTTDVGRIGATLPEVLGRAVRDLMTPSPATIGPEQPVELAAAQMALRKINCLPVVEGGILVGIVTTYDLLDALARRLREG